MSASLIVKLSIALFVHKVLILKLVKQVVELQRGGQSHDGCDREPEHGCKRDQGASDG
jgi:hypothetical protein